jgi:hypothetical protein
MAESEVKDFSLFVVAFGRWAKCPDPAWSGEDGPRSATTSGKKRENIVMMKKMMKRLCNLPIEHPSMLRCAFHSR